jgi:hypothetical protein
LWGYGARGRPWVLRPVTRRTPRARGITALGVSVGTATGFRGLRPGGRRTPQHQASRLEGRNDARTGMPARILAGAMCVQRFDDSLNSAIHITYRISLRSSSMPEPRDPLLKVLTICLWAQRDTDGTNWGPPPAGAGAARRRPRPLPGAARRGRALAR